MTTSISRNNSGHYSIKKHIYEVRHSHKLSRGVSIAYRENKPYVIKYFRLSSRRRRRKEMLKSLSNEINALKFLRNPGIVNLVSYSYNATLQKHHRDIIPICFFVMEYNNGISLYDYIFHSGPFQ